MFVETINSIIAAIQTAPNTHFETLIWYLFLWVPHLILKIKNTINNNPQHNSTQVKNNIKVLQSDDPSLIFENLFIKPEKINCKHDTPPVPINPELLSKQEQNTIKKHFSKGQIAKAMSVINNNNLPIHTVETNKELHDTCKDYFNNKPKLSILNIKQWPSQAPQLINYDDMVIGIKRLKVNASGITGWSASLIKQIFSIGHDIKVNILTILNKIATNQIPSKTSKFLTATILTLLSKPNNTIRPISVGDIWLRLTGSILLNSIIPNIGHLIWPTQLGIATKGGCELANFTTFLMYDFLPTIRSMHLSNSNFNKFKEKIPHTFTLLLDLKNCFGLINIDTLFKILNANSILDSISPYIHLIYGDDSKLFFSLTNDKKILFTEGVAKNGLHQGEIMASLAACLVLIEIIIISTTDFSISEKNFPRELSSFKFTLDGGVGALYGIATPS